MFRALPLGLALAAALILSACGGSNPKLIPQDRADRLTRVADQIAQRTSNHQCTAALSALRRARNQVAELPRRVDRRLTANLNAWLDQIGSRIPVDCKPTASPTPAATATAAPTQAPTASPTPSPSPTETPTPTPSPTPSPSPTATASPKPGGGDQQGASNPSGGVQPPVDGVQPPSTGGVDAGNGNG
jgi:hypothetical protein